MMQNIWSLDPIPQSKGLYTKISRNLTVIFAKKKQLCEIMTCSLGLKYTKYISL
jgi:hypothetical protein